MCQQNNNTKSKKGKHLEYSERQSIERWFNRDKRTKVEIAELLDRTEKTIRNEIKRGLVKNLTTELIEIWVYSADVAQQKYEYYLRAKGPKLKIDNDYELKEYVEKSIKEDRKSPEVIAEEIKEMNFKTKMCARTIRNNIYAGDIYNIKSTDMIYNKEYKDKNKEKTVCEKSATRKKHRLPSRRSKYKRRIWTLGGRFSNRNKEKRSSIIYINRKKDKRRNNSKNTRKESRICSPSNRFNRKKI